MVSVGKVAKYMRLAYVWGLNNGGKQQVDKWIKEMKQLKKKGELNL